MGFAALPQKHIGFSGPPSRARFFPNLAPSFRLVSVGHYDVVTWRQQAFRRLPVAARTYNWNPSPQLPPTQQSPPTQHQLDLLYEALQQIDYPSREAVYLEAKQKAEELELYFLPHGFSFREKGAIWSDYVQYVSDLDVMFFSPMDFVSEDITKPFIVAGESVFESGLSMWIKVASPRGTTYLGRYREVQGGRVHELVQSDTDKLELVGVYPLTCAPGWRVPMDLTVTTREEHFPRDARIDQILSSLKKGDFAKAAMRVRPLIMPKSDKRSFAAAVNREVGQLRFAVRQLELVGPYGGPMSTADALEYVRTRLHLAVETQRDIIQWRYIAVFAMQEQAYLVFLDFWDMFLQIFPSEMQQTISEYFKRDRDAGKHAIAQIWNSTGEPILVETLTKQKTKAQEALLMGMRKQYAKTYNSQREWIGTYSKREFQRSLEYVISGLCALAFFMFALIAQLMIRTLKRRVSRFQEPLIDT